MEAIVEPLARFARSDIQSRSLVTASYFLYWKKIFMKHVTSTTSFQVLKMNRGEIGQTYMKQERTTKMKREFSHTSRKCFERLHCQLELRFDRSQRNVDLTARDEILAMALDPRTKSLARKPEWCHLLPAFKST